jgi:hypothetical protein
LKPNIDESPGDVKKERGIISLKFAWNRGVSNPLKEGNIETAHAL